MEEFVPDLLYNFVATIVNGCGEVECQLENEKVKVTSLQRHKRILSICQDIIFAASNGIVKPPKHVALAVAVKSLTASFQLVEILNGFGHCISDSQTRGLESKIAEKLIAEEGVYLPSILRFPSASRVSHHGLATRKGQSRRVR